MFLLETGLKKKGRPRFPGAPHLPRLPFAVFPLSPTSASLVSPSLHLLLTLDCPSTPLRPPRSSALHLQQDTSPHGTFHSTTYVLCVPLLASSHPPLAPATFSSTSGSTWCVPRTYPVPAPVLLPVTPPRCGASSQPHPQLHLKPHLQPHPQPRL